MSPTPGLGFRVRVLGLGLIKPELNHEQLLLRALSLSVSKQKS